MPDTKVCVETSILGAEESPLSGVAELAYYHASRGAERLMTCGDLFLCEALLSATGDRQTNSLCGGGVS
jgi:hypothetical protein